MVIVFQLFYLTLIIEENDNITLTILVTPKIKEKQYSLRSQKTVASLTWSIVFVQSVATLFLDRR